MAPRFLRLSLFIFLSVVFLACASSKKSENFDTKFNQLAPGMSADQAQKILGPYDLKEFKDGLETWLYRQDDGRYVQLKDSKIVAFGRQGQLGSKEGPSSTATPEPSPITPRGVGLTCKVNSDCQTDNCHFHVCSGKNNCQIPEGAVCDTDSDCCTGFCNFSICKKKR